MSHHRQVRSLTMDYRFHSINGQLDVHSMYDAQHNRLPWIRTFGHYDVMKRLSSFSLKTLLASISRSLFQ